MEPVQPKEGFFDRKECFMLGNKEVHYRRLLPRKAKTWMALDMAEMGLVFDEDAGVVYEGYTFELVLVVLMVKYYTGRAEKPTFSLSPKRPEAKMKEEPPK